MPNLLCSVLLLLLVLQIQEMSPYWDKNFELKRHWFEYFNDGFRGVNGEPAFNDAARQRREPMQEVATALGCRTDISFGDFRRKLCFQEDYDESGVECGPSPAGSMFGGTYKTYKHPDDDAPPTPPGRVLFKDNYRGKHTAQEKRGLLVDEIVKMWTRTKRLRRPLTSEEEIQLDPAACMWAAFEFAPYEDYPLVVEQRSVAESTSIQTYMSGRRWPDFAGAASLALLAAHASWAGDQLVPIEQR